MSSTFDPATLVEILRNNKETESSQKKKNLFLVLDISLIALHAVHDAAEAGNVTCREAMREILKLTEPK